MSYQNSLMRQLWLALIRDFTNEPTYNEFKVYFSNRDTISLIKEAQDVADAILRFSGSEDLPSNKFAKIAIYFLGETGLWTTGYTGMEEDVEVVLQLLRFPKRFQPTDGVPSNADAFWKRNQSMRGKVYNYNNIVIYRMRSFISEWTCSYENNHTHRRPSSGANLEGHKSLTEKVYYLSSIDPLAFPHNDFSGENTPEVFKFPVNRQEEVPKNYKVPRLIGIESEWTTFNATQIADALTSCLPEFVSVDDQDRNQELAYRGSLDNSLATIDFSAASDSVSCSLASKIFPRNIYRDLLRWTAVGPVQKCWFYSNFSIKTGLDAYQVGKVVNGIPVLNKLPISVLSKMSQNPYPNQITPVVKPGWGYSMIATMGNRITFPLEEMVFAAAIATALSFHGCDYHDYIDQLAVYGDDCILPTEFAETFISICELIGFSVNTDKSYYGEEFYRESCGVEFFHGHEISSQYWPRKEVKKKDLSVLIPLQHKVYNLPYTNDVIVKAIRKEFPKITESRPGSPYDDIWSDYPMIQRAYSPYDRSKDKNAGEPEPSCEKHTVFTRRKVPTGVDLTAENYCYDLWLKNPDMNLSDDPVLASLGYRNASYASSMAEPDDCPVLVTRRFLP